MIAIYSPPFKWNYSYFYQITELNGALHKLLLKKIVLRPYKVTDINKSITHQLGTLQKYSKVLSALIPRKFLSIQD